MKKTFLVTLMTVLCSALWAVPAKPGLWQTIRLSNGAEIQAKLCGDEHVHFWMTSDGQYFVKSADGYIATTPDAIRTKAAKRRSHSNLASRLKQPAKINIGDRTHYVGEKKGLVILVQFTDVKFKASNNKDKFEKMLNQENYNEGKYTGSVYDYFRDQSNGQFELHFDLVGPYTLKKNQKYYGQNDFNGDDMHADEMIIEACTQADEEVDFNDYDWDGDGVVDEVFVVYAGKGEADGGGDNTIWPHMWYLDEAGKTLTLDGMKINTYACSNEITPSGSTDGIGTFCHEFSHCLGFPDLYDILYEGHFGMSDFDLMCAGSYNGDGNCPPNYSAHEKMMCGWLEPIELANEDVTVENLLSASQYGDTYIIYNDAHPDEYYMLENRQKTGWDAYIPSKGLMISYVDFDKEIWEQNTPNSIISSKSDMVTQFGYKPNDHQRMTIFHADNDDDSKYWVNYYSYYSKTTTTTDLYPYNKNDSLTATSKPAATLYNKNSQGKKIMQGAVLDIKQNSDGTISFRYRAKQEEKPGPIDPQGEYLFYESFDLCDGKGGNDDNWTTSIASSAFEPDNDDWLYEKAFGGYKCARFGTSSALGNATTPAFTINGEATLTFKAAGWNRDGLDLQLSVEEGNATIEPAELTMASFEWTDYKATIRGEGAIRIGFIPSKRFLLDEVLVVDATTTAIHTIEAPNQKRIFSMDGRYLGNDVNALKPGLYIVNGKKVFVTLLNNHK